MVEWVKIHTVKKGENDEGINFQVTYKETSQLTQGVFGSLQPCGGGVELACLIGRMLDLVSYEVKESPSLVGNY